MIPVYLEYSGDGEFKPVSGHWARVCDRQFTVHERYQIEVREERSGNSHRHFFAAIREAWQNMPEHLGEQYPTEDHLRKRALIECGYRDEHSIVLSSKADAIRTAILAKRLDEYCLARAHERTVIIWTAKSQSSRAMGAKDFQASKTAVLDWLSNMIGVERAQLEKAAA